MDEARTHLIGEVNAPWPLRSGRSPCADDAYARTGVCPQFLWCDPLRGWRHGRVTARRTKRDWAEGMRKVVDVPAPQATSLRVVLDHLNTQTGASLYEAFPPEEARRLRHRVQCHPTAKHASWLTRAASEIGVVKGHCLARRLDKADGLRREGGAGEERRNTHRVNLQWSFTLAVARNTLKQLYPVIEKSPAPT